MKEEQPAQKLESKGVLDSRGWLTTLTHMTEFFLSERYEEV